MLTVSATDLARHTREILNKVAGRGETMAVERNQVVIAVIKPAETTMTAAHAFSGLTFPLFTAQKAKAWLKESKSKFDETVRDPWA